MIIRERSFPHPVLSSFSDDVVPSGFTLDVTVGSDADSFFVDVHFDYENASLAKLIEAGGAIHAVHVECKRNFYRELFPLKNRSGRLTISAGELVGRVEVSGFVCSVAKSPLYQIEGAHEDYADRTFDIQAGDVLAVASTVTFEAFVDYDPLKALSSILTISRAEDLAVESMKVDTTGDRIIATLSMPDYDRYADLKGDPALGPLLANQVVVPVLLEALHEIKGTPEDDLDLEMGRRWFRSVMKKLSDNGIDLRGSETSPLEALQFLLKLPLRRSLDGLTRITALDDEA